MTAPPPLPTKTWIANPRISLCNNCEVLMQKGARVLRVSDPGRSLRHWCEKCGEQHFARRRRIEEAVRRREAQ